MTALVLVQTLYARGSWSHEPGFPPIFPFFGPNAQELAVVDFAGRAVVAMSGATIGLTIDLSVFLGTGGMIAQASVWLLEAGGVDPWPRTRLLGKPSIIPIKRRARHGVRQNLVDLLDGGKYVAWVTIRTPAGGTSSYVAPFLAAGGVGNYFLDDGDPPQVLTDDDGTPLVVG